MTAPRLGRATVEQAAPLLVRALSGGRRARVLLDRGPARALQTDLVTVTVPYPLPDGWSLRTLTCALALQSSPSKEAAASIPWTTFRRRDRAALWWVESEVAVAWACQTWPGLRDELQRLLPEIGDGPVVLDAAELAKLARQRSRSGRRGEPPAIFGRLTPPAGKAAVSSRRRTFIATRWSSRHKARREGALAIPVSGPATERVVHPGAPGTMDALDGRAGHELGIPYDEWDQVRARYRRGYTRVIEADMVDPGQAPGRMLHLPRLTPARNNRRGFDHGDVDIDAVVDWRCAIAAGEVAGDARLFTQLTAVPAPAAWALLVDASASSTLGAGRILRTALGHANALAHSLSAERQQVAVFAFRSHARERVEVRVLKHFHHPYRPLTQKLKPAGYTRLGAAIRHTGRRLLETPACAHVLLYLGDGLPYDEGYGAAYGRADVAKAVVELRTRGVCVYHASLASVEPAALDEMFGPTGWRLATASSDLVPLVREVQDELNRVI